MSNTTVINFISKVVISKVFISIVVVPMLLNCDMILLTGKCFTKSTRGESYKTFYSRYLRFRCPTLG